jgi:hypothetical protein
MMKLTLPKGMRLTYDKWLDGFGPRADMTVDHMQEAYARCREMGKPLIVDDATAQKVLKIFPSGAFKEIAS